MVSQPFLYNSKNLWDKNLWNSQMKENNLNISVDTHVHTHTHTHTPCNK